MRNTVCLWGLRNNFLKIIFAPYSNENLWGKVTIESFYAALEDGKRKQRLVFSFSFFYTIHIFYEVLYHFSMLMQTKPSQMQWLPKFALLKWISIWFMRGSLSPVYNPKERVKVPNIGIFISKLVSKYLFTPKHVKLVRLLSSVADINLLQRWLQIIMIQEENRIASKVNFWMQKTKMCREITWEAQNNWRLTRALFIDYCWSNDITFLTLQLN